MRAIFTDDAEYWFHPGDPEPVRGIDAIVEMWLSEDEPDGCRARPRCARRGRAHRGHPRRGPLPGHQHYFNMWEVHFADDGRARRFVEGT